MIGLSNDIGNEPAVSDTYSWHNRINMIIWSAVEASSSDNLESWYKSLISLYKELISEIFKSSKKKGLLKAREDLKNFYEAYLGNVTNYNFLSSRDKKKVPFNVDPKFVNALENFELQLRHIISENGIWGVPQKFEVE